MTMITNPTGAFGYRDTETAQTRYWCQPVEYVANAAVVLGNSLAFMAIDTTTGLQVEPWDVSDANPLVFAGIALEPAAAGETFLAAIMGYALGLFSTADTPAFGEAVLIGTEDGKLASTARAAGQAQLGVVLGAEITGDLAPVWLYGGTAAVTA